MKILDDITRVPSEFLSNIFRRGWFEYIIIGVVIFVIYWVFFR